MRYAFFNIKQVSNLILTAKHNSREIIPDYLISDSSKNECDLSSQEVYALFQKYCDESFSNYTNRTGQKIQTSSDKFVWETVIVLNEEHTYEDVLNLAYKLAKKQKWRILQVARHEDEGHVDEVSGKKIYNYHAHIIFMMIDEKGIYQFKKRNHGKAKMSEIQTFVAKELGMKRGQSKIKTKRESLNHHQYRQTQTIINDLKHDLMLSENEAENFENVMLIEYELRLKKEAEITLLKKKISELEETYETSESEGECYALQYLHAMKKEEDQTDKIIHLVSKIEKLELENKALRQDFSNDLSSLGPKF